jgi:hypothetical protein
MTKTKKAGGVGPMEGTTWVLLSHVHTRIDSGCRAREPACDFLATQ